MGNMSYCRFQNTLGELRDCADNLFARFGNSSNDRDEAEARRELVDLAITIAAAARDGSLDHIREYSVARVMANAEADLEVQCLYFSGEANSEDECECEECRQSRDDGEES